MIIRYIVSHNKLNNEFNYIEILLLNEFLLDEEKRILNDCDINYQYLDDNTIKILINDFYAYYIEIGEKKEGIYLEKTKRYYEYFKDVPHINETEKTKNLIISKNGIKIEVIVE